MSVTLFDNIVPSTHSFSCSSCIHFVSTSRHWHVFTLQSRMHLHFTSLDATNLQSFPADRPSGDFRPRRSRSFHTIHLHASYAVKPKPGTLFPRARNSRMLLHINWITECSNAQCIKHPPNPNYAQCIAHPSNPNQEPYLYFSSTRSCSPQHHGKSNCLQRMSYFNYLL